LFFFALRYSKYTHPGLQPGLVYHALSELKIKVLLCKCNAKQLHLLPVLFFGRGAGLVKSPGRSLPAKANYKNPAFSALRRHLRQLGVGILVLIDAIKVWDPPNRVASILIVTKWPLFNR
jgi:hypothetical protein